MAIKDRSKQPVLTLPLFYMGKALRSRLATLAPCIEGSLRAGDAQSAVVGERIWLGLVC